MAVAACPPSAPEAKTRPEESEPPSCLEDIPHKVSTAYFETEKRLGDVTKPIQPKGGEQADRSAAKPGPLLDVQFEDDYNRGKRDPHTNVGETRESRTSESDNDESPGERR